MANRIARSVLCLLLPQLSILVGAQHAPHTQRSQHTPVPHVLLVLLANERLLAVGWDGRVRASVRLSTLFRLPMGVGDYLAVSPGAKVLYALALGPAADRLVMVDSSTLQVRTSYPLDPTTRFTGMVVEAKSGLLYLFGTAPRNPGPCDPHPCSAAAVVQVVDPQSGQAVSTWIVHQADGRDWFVLQGAVSPMEREVYLSYHGSNTSGLDWLTITGHQVHRCTPSRPAMRYPGTGCLLIHGRFMPESGGFIATTGNGPVIFIDRHGVVHRRWNMRLTGNHLMDFVLDRRTDQFFAVGSCGYTGGLSTVNVQTGAVRVLVKPATSFHSGSLEGHMLCGELVIEAPGSRLVIAANPLPVPQGLPARVLIVDRQTGKIMVQVRTAAEVISLLTVS